MTYFDFLNNKNVIEFWLTRKSMENCTNFFQKKLNLKNIIAIDDKYFFNDDALNIHHYNSDIAQLYIIPNIITKFNFTYEINNYNRFIVKDSRLNYDISLYEIKENNETYYLEYLIDKYTLKLNGNHFKVLRTNPYAYSTYHSLFSATHFSCIIKNEKSFSNKKLLYICDSLAALIAPILCYYFNEIICIDIVHNFNLSKQLVDKYLTNFSPDYTLYFHSIDNIRVLETTLLIV